MSNLALITTDTAHAAATNTKTALEAKGHTVTLVADSTLGSFDDSSYHAIVAVRNTNSQTVADQLRALVDAGKPAVWSLGVAGTTAGTGRTSIPTMALLCGTTEVADYTSGANGIRVSATAHPIISGFSNAAETAVFTAANYAYVMDTGQSYVGTSIATGDPSVSTISSQVAGFAVEIGTPDVTEVEIGARVAVLGFLYGGQSAYTANGQTLLDQAVEWVTETIPVEPGTGTLTLTGTTPATAPAPAGTTLTLSTGTPVAQVVVPTAVPATGELVLTGGDAPTMPIAVLPGTGLLRFASDTPEPLSFATMRFNLSLPPLTVLLSATGPYGTLNLSLPALRTLFLAAGANGQLDVTLPALDALLDASGPRGDLRLDLPTLSTSLRSGGGLSLESVTPTAVFGGLTGSVGGLQLALPVLTESFTGGGKFAADLPPFEALLGGTVGAAGNLTLNLPPFAALFGGSGTTGGTLVVNLPGLTAAFAGYPQTRGNLVATFPVLESVFAGYAGEVAALQVGLPALTALLTAYEDLTGELVITLPAFRSLLGGTVPSRFDGTFGVLQYRRPT